METKEVPAKLAGGVAASLERSPSMTVVFIAFLTLGLLAAFLIYTINEADKRFDALQTTDANQEHERMQNLIDRCLPAKSN